MTAAGAPGEWDPGPLLSQAYRAAVTGADAYRAVRLAVQIDRGILRAGNRFLRVDRFRELAFIALGNASASMALGVQRTLGEQLTQGYVAGPVPLPPEVPFRSVTIPAGSPGTAEALRVAGSVRELAEGLHSDDLLLLLLSPGAFSFLVEPPPGAEAGPWFQLLGRLEAHAGPSASALVARVSAAGLVGGGLLPRAEGPRVEALVVDDGTGAALIGGGPTVPVSSQERYEARTLLQSLGLSASLPTTAGSAPLSAANPTLRPLASKPVVIASPADGLRSAGDHFSDRRWLTRLASVTVPGGPEDLARMLGTRAEEEFRKLPSRPMGPEGRPAAGLAVFAGAPLCVSEGMPLPGARDRFFAEMARELARRDAIVALLPTAGDLDTTPAGGFLSLSRPGRGRPAEPRRSPLGMPSGITDVGSIAVWLLPFPRGS